MRNILIHRRFHRGMGSVLLSLFFMLGIGLSATAQEKTVSLQMKQVSLVQVFDRLEQMIGIHFLYNAEMIKAKGVVDINVTNKTLDGPEGINAFYQWKAGGDTPGGGGAVTGIYDHGDRDGRKG